MTTHWRMRTTETKMSPPAWDNAHKAVNSGACPHFKDGETEPKKGQQRPAQRRRAGQLTTEIQGFKIETQRYYRGEREREILRRQGMISREPQNKRAQKEP